MLENWNFNNGRVADFWTFVSARHEVYINRFVKKLPAPWTSDPVIRTSFFTNVYRELDAGTIYLEKNILNNGALEDECFEILMYRLFNNRHTYGALKTFERRFGDWENWKLIASFLKSYQECSRMPIFSMAHMTTSMRHGGAKSKIDAACYLLHEHWRNKKEICKHLLEASSLKQLCNRVSGLAGYGSFLAYEIGTDFGYSKRLGRFSENDWVNPGPGCRRGIDLLLEGQIGRTVTYQSVIEELRRRQFTDFQKYNIEFSGKEMTLRNIEHSLCEFFKYTRIKMEGKSRRLFNSEVRNVSK